MIEYTEADTAVPAVDWVREFLEADADYVARDAENLRQGQAIANMDADDSNARNVGHTGV